MISGQGYVENGTHWDQDHVAGYAFDNIAIFNALVNGSGALQAYAEDMDKCSTMSNDGTLDSSGYQLHYRGLGYCMKPSSTNSVSNVPPPCWDTSYKQDDEDNNKCTDEPIKYARKAWSGTSNHGGDVGLARDGHVIKGPYNSDGETWDCDEHDICNGTFLSDGSYAYVATETFPYIIGCWGPAPGSNGDTDYVQRQRASCSNKTCGAFSGLSIMLGTIAIFATLNTF